MSDKSCPFCGVSAWSQKEGVMVYGCATSIDPHQVLRSATCVAKERDILRQRINAAIKALHKLQYRPFCDCYDTTMEPKIRNVLDILRGNSPINLEGS